VTIPSRTQDAVVIVPGIMGSALRDEAGLVWGLSPSWYVAAWSGPSRLGRLRLTDDELQGRYGRVRAAGLVVSPAYAPGLGGIEPYTRLIDQLKPIVADEAAILQFAYDWRLPVAHNASVLAESAYGHLMRWRSHPKHAKEVLIQPDQREAMLVFISHSMGGLLVRALALVPGGSEVRELTRLSITIGTPFEGAADAAVLLGRGSGAPVPLPRRRVRRLVASMPGLHDLLPSYRCVDLGHDVARLTPADVGRIGGSEELAERSLTFRRELAGVPLIGHRQILGLGQRTASSLAIRDGAVQGLPHTFEVNSDNSLVRLSNGQLKRLDRRGDGTVPRNSAELIDGSDSPSQQHGALARTPEVIRDVRRMLTQPSAPGPRLGGAELGLETPDLIEPEERWVITVTGARRAACRIFPVASGRELPPVPLRRYDQLLRANGPMLAPGLYRISAEAHGASPVIRMMLVADPASQRADRDILAKERG
jgi:hypothetical protein